MKSAADDIKDMLVVNLQKTGIRLLFLILQDSHRT
jgi:hypothetical protein